MPECQLQRKKVFFCKIENSCINKVFQARIFASKSRSLPIECELDLTHNYYAGLKNLIGTNTLAYYCRKPMAKKKRVFENSCINKVFQARIFASKTGAYP
jgi:hypothetical protein